MATPQKYDEKHKYTFAIVSYISVEKNRHKIHMFNFGRRLSFGKTFDDSEFLWKTFTQESTAFTHRVDAVEYAALELKMLSLTTPPSLFDYRRLLSEDGNIPAYIFLGRSRAVSRDAANKESVLSEGVNKSPEPSSPSFNGLGLPSK